MLLVVLVEQGSTQDEDREQKSGFREKIACIDNGKFYRSVPFCKLGVKKYIRIPGN